MPLLDRVKDLGISKMIAIDDDGNSKDVLKAELSNSEKYDIEKTVEYLENCDYNKAENYDIEFK